MQAYWLNFIKTGDPNGPGLPHWPTTAEAPGQVLRLDAESGMTEDPYLALYPVIDGFQNSCRPD